MDANSEAQQARRVTSNVGRIRFIIAGGGPGRQDDGMERSVLVGL
jgi:hypothetical protein